MRFAKLMQGTLVLALTLQPLLGQTAKAQVSTPDPSKTNKFDLARSSGFDFSRMADLTRREYDATVAKLGNSHPPNSMVVLDPSRARSLANGDVCYSLRVYKFQREDGDAPRMTGSTTCTPANRAALKATVLKDAEATNTPEARHVPE